MYSDTLVNERRLPWRRNFLRIVVSDPNRRLKINSSLSSLSLSLSLSSNKIIKAHISEQRCWNLETTLRGWKPWPSGRWLIFAAPALPCPRQATATDGRPSSKHFIIAPNRVSQTTFGDLQPSEARAGNHATTLGWSWGKKRSCGAHYVMVWESQKYTICAIS